MTNNKQLVSTKDVVMAMYAAYGAGDMQTLSNTLSNNIVWTYHGTKEIHHAGTYHGKDGVSQFFNDVNAHIEYLEFQPNQFIVEDNIVIVLGNEKQKIKHNNAILEQSWVQIYTVKSGLIVKMEEFSNTAYAVKIHNINPVAS
ncbi:MAG: nuclear transport factor 2 family protein [Proteobacteria bacterium]|nr:nuclear transport factor 2 family protein [Pseudomonadota bacterium]